MSMLCIMNLVHMYISNFLPPHPLSLSPSSPLSLSESSSCSLSLSVSVSLSLSLCLPLQKDKILGWSNSKVFAGNKLSDCKFDICFLKSRKIFWEKDMLVSSILSFSLNVSKRHHPDGCWGPVWLSGSVFDS